MRRANECQRTFDFRTTVCAFVLSLHRTRIARPFIYHLDGFVAFAAVPLMLNIFNPP